MDSQVQISWENTDTKFPAKILMALEEFTAIIRKIEAMNTLPEEATRLLPPISVEEMDWKGFQERTGVSQRVITYCKRHCHEMHPQSCRQLVYMLVEFFRKAHVCNVDHIWADVGKILLKTCQQTRVMYENYTKYLDGHCKPQGRPRILSENDVQVIIHEITEKFCQKQPMTKRDVMIFIYERWKVEVSKRFVVRLIDARREISQADAFPMEESRAEVTNRELERFYDQLREVVNGVHPINIFNVDEIGFCRKARHQKVRCVVPSNAVGQHIEYIPQMDTDKTFTLIAGVSLAGTSLTPMIICPLKSLPKDFLSTEVWNGRDCVLGHSETGFANHFVFNTWYDEIFRPHLARNRFELCDEDAPAVLICDGFRGHEDQEILAKAAEDNVMVVFIPAHSSHLTQALDKFAFANMKRHYQNNKELNESSLDRNGKKIRKMLSAYYSVLTPFTIRASWRAVGIETIRDEQGVVLSVSVNGQEVIARHAELGAQRSRRKRVPLDRDHLVNRAQLDRVAKGLCPRCGQVMPDHDEPVTPRRIRLVMGPQE